MSIEYDNYLKQHRENVAKAAEWIRDNLQQDVQLDLDSYQQIMYMHDYSKDSNEEYGHHESSLLQYTIITGCEFNTLQCVKIL